MLQKITLNFYDNSCQYINAFTKGRFWLIKSAIILFIISILTSFPNYDWYIKHHNHLIFEAIDWQIAHPFQQLPEKYTDPNGGGPTSHLNKRWSRITVPLIAYIFGLNTFHLIIIQHIIGILFFALIIQVSYQLCSDRISSFLIGFICATTFVGKWVFQDFFCYDGIAYFLLLLAMWKRSFTLIFLSILSAGFTDERALIASSLVYIWWYLKINGLKNTNLSSFFKFNNHSPYIAIIAAWVAYFSFRYFILVQYFGLKMGDSGIGFIILRYNFKFIPMGFFTLLEIAWGLIFFAYIILLAKKKYFLFILIFLSSSASFFAGFMVFDVSRSLAYAFPLLIISLYIMHEEENEHLRKHLLLTSICCFLIPTHIVVEDGIQWLSPIIPKIFKLL